MGAVLSGVYLIVIAVFAGFVCVGGKTASLSPDPADVSPGTTHAPSSSSRSAGRGAADQGRREAFARQMASVVLMVVTLLWLISCLNMFTRLL